MNNTAYYQSISQAYKQVCEGSERTNKVPNASKQLSKIYDEQYGGDIAKRNRITTRLTEIYGGRYGYRQTASGRWRERDEPDSAEQDRQADAINKMMTKRKAAASRERLKSKGAVPVKAGKRLFEDFMEEANSRTGKKTKENDRDHKRLKQVYLAARALEYDKWVMFITEMM